MKKYDLLTPEGTRDLIFDECAALRNVSENLRRIFISHGYSEVITPGLEFFDVFNNKSRSYSQEALYKLTDAKGRLMVLRPDSTMPIARIVGTRLRDSRLPIKLFCDQTIYRAHPKDSGRDDEFYQCGIEIIGGDVMLSDMEALSLAAEVMESLGEENYRFEIGESGFFTALCSKLALSEQELDNIRGLVLTKNYPELEAALSDKKDNAYAKALAKLPSLFGGSEVFEKAGSILPDDSTRDMLTRLKKVYENVCALGIGDKVSVDLGIVSRNEDYYTGIVFRGYVEGYGMPVLTGGRYDRLIADFGKDIPATGFAVNENAAAASLLKRAGGSLIVPPDVLIFAGTDAVTAAVKHCRALIAKGEKTEYAGLTDIGEARLLARERHIKRIDTVSADGSVKSETVGKEEL